MAWNLLSNELQRMVFAYLPPYWQTITRAVERETSHICIGGLPFYLKVDQEMGEQMNFIKRSTRDSKMPDVRLHVESSQDLRFAEKAFRTAETEFNVTCVTFGHRFNRPVDLLPVSITRINFGKSFNRPVDHLPASLTHLRFGASFNQPVDHLPASLIHLELGYSFSQSIEHLPASISSITLCRKRADYSEELEAVIITTSVETFSV